MHSLKVENDEVDTIYLSGHFDVAKQHIQETLLLLPEHIKQSREEKGCLDFRVTQSKKTEGRFQVFEKFNSKRAYLYHQKRIKKSKWKNIMTKLKRDYEIIGIDTI
jgi:quinol monooxygenase YgiN